MLIFRGYLNFSNLDVRSSNLIMNTMTFVSCRHANASLFQANCWRSLCERVLFEAYRLGPGAHTVTHLSDKQITAKIWRCGNGRIYSFLLRSFDRDRRVVLCDRGGEVVHSPIKDKVTLIVATQTYRPRQSPTLDNEGAHDTQYPYRWKYLNNSF